MTGDEGRCGMIKVDVVSVGMDKHIGAYVILLHAGGRMRALPIFAGPFEAGAISLAIEHVDSPRPLVHDLLKAVIDRLEGRVDRVEITGGVEEDAYLACVSVITRTGRQARVDARPGDAVALALRAEAPIFIADEVMDRSGVFLQRANGAPEASPETPGAGGVVPPSPGLPGAERPGLDRLEARLRWLVREEAYEAAAVVRDHIVDVSRRSEENRKIYIDIS